MTSDVPTSKPIHPAFPKPGPGPVLGLDDSLVVRREIDIDDVIASPWIGLHYSHELLLHHRHEELEPPTVDEAVRADGGLCALLACAAFSRQIPLGPAWKVSFTSTACEDHTAAVALQVPARLGSALPAAGGNHAFLWRFTNTLVSLITRIATTRRVRHQLACAYRV